jgi:hypothetical protein
MEKERLLALTDGVGKVALLLYLAGITLAFTNA